MHMALTMINVIFETHLIVVMVDVPIEMHFTHNNIFNIFTKDTTKINFIVIQRTCQD